MINHSTNRDVQRVAFVESLHTSMKVSSLQKQTEKTIDAHNRFMTIASSYASDGLTESESIELLMIDGISREAAENYVSLAMCEEEMEQELSDYSFQFEDDYGKIWSSYDLNRTIKASNDDEAWKMAEEMIDPDLEVCPASRGRARN